MCNGDGQIPCAMIVSSIQVDEIAHGVMQVSRRSNFKPKAIFTDTWPAKEAFWLQIFGPIVGVLGIFHFMKRIVDTLRQGHRQFHIAL